MEQFPLELNGRGRESHPWTVGLRLGQGKVQILKEIGASGYRPDVLGYLNVNSFLESIMAVQSNLGTVKLRVCAVEGIM